MRMIISAGVVLVVVLWGLLRPQGLAEVFDTLLADITRNLGWFYLWIVAGLVLFAVVLAFSRYGNLKLGDDDDEPEFSNPAWFAMLFAAGMGIGLVFWGVAEPLSHFAAPPPGIEARTPDAANAAMRYSFFHWGLHPWATYSVVALAMAFFRFRRGASALVSSAIDFLPWAPLHRLGPFFDAVAIVATAFGVAASLGLGAMQINGGLNALAGVPIGTLSQVLIILVTTALFLASALSGVERGIKWLSLSNLVIAGLLALAVLAIGPTVAIIDTFTGTTGAYLTDLVRMSLRTTPFRDSGWVGDWTVFYWAWWIAWSPFVGLFIARISRGRTVREFVLGTALAPSLAAFAWFSVFGGTALNYEIAQGVALAEAAQANPETALFRLFDALPALGLLLAAVATLVVLIFFVTSGDSAILVLGTLSGDGRQDPGTLAKLLWGTLVAGIAIALLYSGGLQALQTATIVFALPFTIVILLLVLALWRGLREDWAESQRKERELRRKLREIASRLQP